MIFTDPTAQFDCPEGVIAGTATYDLMRDEDGQWGAELVKLTLGPLEISRSQLIETFGKEDIRAGEEWASRQVVDDPMGEAAGRAWDRLQAEAV